METDKMSSDSLAGNKTEIKKYRRPSLPNNVKQDIREYLLTGNMGIVPKFRYHLNTWNDAAYEAGLSNFLHGMYVNGTLQRLVMTDKVKAYLTWISREPIRDAPSRDS